MIDGQRVTALVPARAGSKGIADKNLQPLAGVSLVRWATDLARSLPEIDRCVVSTDGEEIAAEGARGGAAVHRRPPELSSDTSLVIDTVRAVLDEERAAGHPADILVLLEPTSPFRVAEDVRGCLRGLLEGADSAATFTEAHLHPQRAFRIEDGTVRPYLDGAVPWLPRQQLTPPAYESAGAVYAFWVDRLPAEGVAVLFGTVHPVLIPRARTLDIDDPLDLELADVLLRRGAVPGIDGPPAP